MIIKTPQTIGIVALTIVLFVVPTMLLGIWIGSTFHITERESDIQMSVRDYIYAKNIYISQLEERYRTAENESVRKATRQRVFDEVRSIGTENLTVENWEFLKELRNTLNSTW